MLGSALSFTGYLLVLFVLALWMVVRIWKRSPLLAILSFFFWPVAIIALFKNWGDEDADIRIPFFLSVLVAGLMAYMAVRTVEKGAQELAYALSDEDIALIREDDPELAQELEAARAAQRAELGGGVVDVETSDGEHADLAVEAAERVGSATNPAESAAKPVPRDPAVVEAEHRHNLDRAAALVSWQFGRIDFPVADSVLQMPQHFRFASRATLLQIARLRGTPLSADVLGWVVHRDVNLAREDAWYVQVRFVPLQAPLAAPDTLLDPVERAAEEADHVARIARALGGDPASLQSMAWDTTAALASWQRPDPSAPYADHAVARVLPRGILEFSVPSLHAAHAELGARAARLVAKGTLPGTSTD